MGANYKLSARDAADILLGRLVLTSESERRAAMSDIADMIIALDDENADLREWCYLLEERIAIMTEGVVNDG